MTYLDLVSESQWGLTARLYSWRPSRLACARTSPAERRCATASGEQTMGVSIAGGHHHITTLTIDLVPSECSPHDCKQRRLAGGAQSQGRGDWLFAGNSDPDERNRKEKNKPSPSPSSVRHSSPSVRRLWHLPCWLLRWSAQICSLLICKEPWQKYLERQRFLAVLRESTPGGGNALRNKQTMHQPASAPLPPPPPLPPHY